MVKEKAKKEEKEMLVNNAAEVYFRLFVKDLLKQGGLEHYPDEAIVDLLRDSYFFIENYVAKAKDTQEK